MTKAADLALGKIAAVKTALIEFTDGDDAIAVADAGVVTLLTTAVAKSEGGAVTTNIAQGLAKCWNRYDQHVSTDSLNVGSMTDQATGRYLTTFTNNMANNTFAVSICSIETSYNNIKSGTNSTSTIGCQMSDTNGNDNDQNVNNTIVCGDLA